MAYCWARLIHGSLCVFIDYGPFYLPSSTAAQEVIHFLDLLFEDGSAPGTGPPHRVTYYGRYGPIKDTGAPDGRTLLIHQGLKYAVNLESLNLYQNSVEGLSPWRSNPPAGLEPGGTESKDISALRGLTALASWTSATIRLNEY